MNLVSLSSYSKLVMHFHDSRNFVKIFYRSSCAGILLYQLNCSKKKIRLFEKAIVVHFTPIQELSLAITVYMNQYNMATYGAYFEGSRLLWFKTKALLSVKTLVMNSACHSRRLESSAALLCEILQDILMLFCVFMWNYIFSTQFFHNITKHTVCCIFVSVVFSLL
jgi:hypothetical protein